LQKYQGSKMKNYFILIDDKAKKICCDAVKTAPNNYVVTIEPRNRTIEQNRYYWALCKAVAEQKPENGVFYRADVWHEMFKKAFVPSQIQELPDKTTITMYKSTTKLTLKEFSILIESVMEFCRENNINISHLNTDMPYAAGEVSI